jgi:phosphatidylglycerophosphatase A
VFVTDPTGFIGKTIATWFGSGLLPKAPGTWGSLAALPFAWLIAGHGGALWLAIATVLVYVVGVWATAIYLRTSDDSDPGPVVVDEVAGMWMTLVLVPVDPLVYAFGFAAFRIADIFKPWPASWADRTVKGAHGVMLDDVLAALYSALATWIFATWVV